MKLSEHFTLAELTASDTAARRGIDNTPPAEVLPALRETAALLEQVRALLGAPITITSGYRCLELNRAIGSGDTSAHVRGRAADFTCRGFGTPLEVCRAIEASPIAFDQLIHEFGAWTHIAWAAGAGGRRQVLTIDAGGTRLGL